MKASRILFLLFFIALLGSLVFLIYVGYETIATWKYTYQETGQRAANTEIPETGKNMTSVLLLGIDRQEFDSEQENGGRSDAIILVLLNKKTGQITALSIPRDTRTEIRPGQYDKLAHAYNNGVENSIQLVENLLDFPVDYYLTFNYQAFEQFIDIIGGIEIDSEKEMVFGHHRIKEGQQKMDGQTAEMYVRYRGDNEGDFGRMRRQQQVIDAVMDQIINPTTIVNIDRFFKLAKEHIRHNIPADSIRQNALEYTTLSTEKFKKLSLEGVNAQIDSLWYVILKTDELMETRQELQSELSKAR